MERRRSSRLWQPVYMTLESKALRRGSIGEAAARWVTDAGKRLVGAVELAGGGKS